MCNNNNTGNVAGNDTENASILCLDFDMPAKKRAVTIQGVAKAAGVSVSTVSRVLNAKVDVASDTQARILAVIDELGYTSNLAARSMRSHKKNLIGLVVPDIGFPYAFEIMKGINRAIAESSFDLLLYTTGDFQKNGTASHEQHYVSLLNNSITDGVIIVASSVADFITDAPIVAVDPHVINPNFPSVQGTNYQGALDATNYLLSLGHRRIGFITGRPGIGSARRRLKGYRDALLNAGIDLEDALIAPGDFTTKTGYKCACQLLSLDTPPTAIFAANDQSALGVYQAADELGVRIPDELSVVGFDNITEAKYLGLTTVDQFLADMGYVAIQMLIKLINNEPI
ncbi:MAG: LacI family DNA-binding transcriptional regulator, partial [Candidatus Atribacteria bacterium]|nr:LacI family DNA-binding transcriptional regulator [Candidatus Atribacteria bacterium]